MQFINPIEILGLQDIDPADIDSGTIRKAKRRFFAEIDLSDDGVYLYKAKKLSKSEIEPIIDKLEESKLIFYYHLLANSPHLNDYLATGDYKSFWEPYPIQSPEWKWALSSGKIIDFISPYFSVQYANMVNDIFWRVTEKGPVTLDTLKFILNPSKNIFINKKDEEIAYSILSKKIGDSIQKIEKQIDNISSKSNKENITKLKYNKYFLEGFDYINQINILPEYFSSIRNSFANNLRRYAVAVYNDLDDFQLAEEAISKASRVNASRATSEQIQKDFITVKNSNVRRQEELKYANEIESVSNLIDFTNKLAEQIKLKKVSSENAINQLNQSVNINIINNYPDLFEDLRDNLAINLRDISVQLWNSYHNLSAANSIISNALELKTSPDVSKLLTESKSQLKELEVQAKREFEQIKSLLHGINNQIQQNGMAQIRADKVKETLNGLFTLDLIENLKILNDITLKRLLYNELEKILLELDAFYTHEFLLKIKPIGANDGILAVRIEKALTGVGFKAKNVLNNVGTGYSKAHKAQPQLVGLLTFIFIIFLIAFLTQGC